MQRLIPLVVSLVVLLFAGSASAQTTTTNNGGPWCRTYGCTTTFQLSDGSGEIWFGPVGYTFGYSYTDGSGDHAQTCDVTGGSISNNGLTKTYDFTCPDGTTGISVQQQVVVGYVSCGGRAHRTCAVYRDDGGTTTIK